MERHRLNKSWRPLERDATRRGKHRTSGRQDRRDYSVCKTECLNPGAEVKADSRPGRVEREIDARALPPYGVQDA